MECNRRLYFGLVLGFFLSINGGDAQVERNRDDEPTVDAILAKYIEAAGGSALSELKGEIREGTLLRGTTGRVPWKTAFQAPGKWRYRQTFAWGDGVCYGCDDSDAWIQDKHGVEDMPPRQLLEMRFLLDGQAPLRIGEWLPQMAVTGSETINGLEAVTVEGVSSEGHVIDLAFDRDSGLLLRAGQIVFEDYRDMDGVKRPNRVRLGMTAGEAHLEMVMVCNETRHDAGADELKFERPQMSLPLTDAPLYKRRAGFQPFVEVLDACSGVYRSPTNPNVTYTVERQDHHLMFHGTGWPLKYEMMAESETDYYFQFLGWEFQFQKDASGRIMTLKIDANGRVILAQRVE